MVGTYRLTPAARKDLEGIWAYTNESEGIERTLDYIDSIEAACDKLCAMPKMCRERKEYSPPVRICPHRQHLIVYKINEDHIDIIRILHVRMHVDEKLSQG